MKVRKLKDVADIILGYPFESELFNENGDGICLVRGMNVTERSLRFGSDARYWSHDTSNLTNYFLRANDIVIGMDGSKVGKNFAVVKESKLPLLLVQRVACVRAKEGVYQPYLWLVISSSRFVNYINTIKTGSSIPHISGNQIGDYPVPIPDFESQKSLGDFLWEMEEKISLNNSICSDLEAMAKLLYDYWFVQFDFPDENGKPYKSSGGKMVWNEELKREIPEGWGTWLLGNHTISARGVSYSTPDLNATGVPMLNLASFCADDTYKAEGIKYYAGKYEQSKVLKPYELIMCNTQQTALDPTKDIIGHCLLVPDIFDGDIVSSHHVNHLTFDQDYLNYLVYGESKTVWFHKYMAGLSSGTNILGMDFDGVYKYRMVMPPQDILKKFAAIIHDLEARKSLILKENQQLTSLRDFLLPMLMNGQVKVKEVV